MSLAPLSTVTARYDDTLVDIARRHGLGYQDIVLANPDVNVWVPGEGTEIRPADALRIAARTARGPGAESR